MNEKFVIVLKISLINWISWNEIKRFEMFIRKFGYLFLALNISLIVFDC